MVTRITPQSFRWARDGETEEALFSDVDQSANTAPTPGSAPPKFSAATSGPAAANNAPAAVNSVGAQPAGSGLIINLVPDSSVASAPPGFVAAIQAAAAVFEQTFRGDNITINIGYGWGTFNSTVDPNLTGSTGAEGGPLNGDNISYSTLKSWLTANVNSVADATMVASLPNSISSNFFVASAEEKALGHFSGSSSAVDGAIGFGTASSPTFWLEAALHEIAHAIGRTTAFYEGGEPTVMDLLRYSSPGTFQWTGGQPAYLSIDGGNTKLANFSTISDYGDFAVDSLTPNDPFDYQGNGSVTTLTALDIELMNVLGFEVPLGSGQVLNISSGEGSNDVAVLSGGTLDVLSGGTASGTTISSGGDEFVSSGGTTAGTVVSNGGFEVILPGGSASGSTLASGGFEYVNAGGLVSGTTVSSGAIQNDVGTASGTVPDGFQTIFAGGAANGTTINSGGYEYILPGGSVSRTVVSSGGIQNDDGTATGTTLGGFQIIFSGATANGTTITSTGYQYILPGATVSGATVAHGGTQNDDGTANGTTLGGLQVIFSGAVASGTTLTSGGYEYILPGGVASNTVLSSGSLENDDGTANGVTISSGSEAIVFGGATASGVTVDAGGFEIVVSGGVTSATTISGGNVELGGGNGAGSGTITFSGGGILKLDQSTAFTGLVAGFASPDQLDLADIAFGSGTTLSFSEATNQTSGTLTVTDGAHTASILLLGQYAAGNFHLASDGNGGTLIGDPPVTVMTDSNPATLVASHHG